MIRLGLFLKCRWPTVCTVSTVSCIFMFVVYSSSICSTLSVVIKISAMYFWQTTICLLAARKSYTPVLSLWNWRCVLVRCSCTAVVSCVFLVSLSFLGHKQHVALQLTSDCTHSPTSAAFWLINLGTWTSSPSINGLFLWPMDCHPPMRPPLLKFLPPFFLMRWFIKLPLSKTAD